MPVQMFVPFYGDPALLKLTVHSVQAQSDPGWTLTVVDDGYPDDSLAGWFRVIGDSRIRYLRNPERLGANANYRRCLALADDELLVLLGADDELLPNYVSTVVAAHRAHPAAAVIQPGVQVIDERGRPARSLRDTVKRSWLRPASGPGGRELCGEELATSLLRGNWLYFPSLAFRRLPAQRIGFRAGLDVVQDLALVLDLISAGHSMVLDDTVCFRYRRHSGSDSSTRALTGSRFVEEHRFFLEAAERADRRGWSRAARVARRHLLSRANALTVLPRAVHAENWAGVSTLVGHVLGIHR